MTLPYDDNVYAVASQGQTILEQGLFELSTTQKYDLGHTLRLNDGRTYKYASTAADLVAGHLLMANNTVRDAAAYDDIAVVAHAVNSTTLAITTHANGALDENELAGGYAVIHDGTVSAGQGHMYKVKGHAAIAASTAGNLELFDPIRVALTTSAKVLVIPALEYKVVQCTVNNDIADSTPVGVAPVATTASTDSTTQYFWMQTYGPAVVLQGTAPTADPGTPCRPGDTAGSVEQVDYDAAGVDSVIVGYSICALAAASDSAPIYLTIAA